MKSFCLLLAACVFTFLLGEIGLRIFGIAYPYFYLPDPITGYFHKPGAEGLWQKEGETYITINRAGLRNREISVEKPPHTFRVALLGDSYTEALQLPLDLTYGSRLEHALTGCPALVGQNVEVVNFGVSGYNTAQELLVLRHKVPPYDPDLILLALYTGNDIRGNSRELNGNNLSPYFTLREGRAVLDDSFRRSITFRLQQLPFSSEAFEISRVLQLIREGKYKLKAYLNEATYQPWGQQASDRGIDLNAMLYLEPPDPIWEEAWQITEALIVLVRQEVEKRGGRFLLVSLSNPEQVHPDLQHRRAEARRLGVPDLFYPDRRLQAFAKREGTPLLSLAERFAAYAEQQNIFLHGFPNAHLGQGHWNAEAHQLAGYLMSERICAMVRTS